MGFWKDDTPSIDKLIKNDQDVIVIEHSQGVFNMNANEIREIKLTNDYYSSPVNENQSLRLSAFFAFLIMGASQNLISYLMLKIFGQSNFVVSYNITSERWLDVSIVITTLIIQFILWFVLLEHIKLSKAIVNWFLEKKQDVIVISTNAKEFKFRLLDDKTHVPFLESATRTKNAESVVKWRLFLLVFCIILLVIIHLDVPYWFDMVLNNSKNFKLIDILGINSDQEYVNYRNSDVGILRLLFDGFLSNLTLFVGIGLFVILFLIGFALFTLILLTGFFQILFSIISVYYVISYPFYYFRFGQKRPIKNIFKLTFELSKISLFLLNEFSFGIFGLIFGILDKWIKYPEPHDSLKNAIKIVSADSTDDDDIMLTVVILSFFPYLISSGLMKLSSYTEYVWKMGYVPINNIIKPFKQATEISGVSVIQVDLMAFIFLFSLVPYFFWFLIIFLFAKGNNKNGESKA